MRMLYAVSDWEYTKTMPILIKYTAGFFVFHSYIDCLMGSYVIYLSMIIRVQITHTEAYMLPNATELTVKTMA